MTSISSWPSIYSEAEKSTSICGTKFFLLLIAKRIENTCHMKGVYDSLQIDPWLPIIWHIKLLLSLS